MKLKELYSLFYRRIFNFINRNRIILGHDTNLTSKNLSVKSGKITIGDGVGVRNGCFFSTDGGELSIGSRSFFNRNCIIACHLEIKIGKNVLIGPNVCIFDHNHKFSKTSGVKKSDFSLGEVIIGDGCWIGANAVILKGTRLGNNCIVAAGTVLFGTYPDNTIIRNKIQVVAEEIH